jgi:ornithine decarboxylase
VIRRGASVRGAAPFKVYGPTCDSDDVLGAPLLLPADVAEGDWIEINMMGAYSTATQTPFNGFSEHGVAVIEE